jgi:Flp pilus assembly protein TadD
LDMREAKFADAEREFKIASQLDPGRSSLHFLLGQAYKHSGKQREATAEFAEAARLANSANGRSHD